MFNWSFLPMDSTNLNVLFRFDVLLHPRLFCFVINTADTCKYMLQAKHISVRGGGAGAPPCRKKNSIIRAKVMYRSGKDTVRWDTCCSERQLTTDSKRPLSYHSLLHMYWQSRQWTSIKVWGQWPGRFVRNLTSRKNHLVHLWPTNFIRANYVQPP